LAQTYLALRRFRLAEQTYDRIIGLKPDDPSLKIYKAYLFTFGEKADLANYLTVFRTVPSTLEDRVDIVSSHISAAIFDRDWTKAKEMLDHSHNEEFVGMDYTQAKIPRGCIEIWLTRLQQHSPVTTSEFTAARDQLNRKVQESPHEPDLLSALGIVDAALGHKEEAIQEAKRATEMLPVSKNAEIGPSLVVNLAIAYEWSDELELAFQQLTISVNTPNSLLYGELKVNPVWDQLRKDPRFEKLLAELAPRE
jgi:tetratricopeptide (TPR) repeat protein